MFISIHLNGLLYLREAKNPIMQLQKIGLNILTIQSEIDLKLH